MDNLAVHLFKYVSSIMFMCICVLESRIINDKDQRTLSIVFNHFNKKVDQPNQPKTVSPPPTELTEHDLRLPKKYLTRDKSPQLCDVLNLSSEVQRNEIFSCNACGGFSSDSQ